MANDRPPNPQIILASSSRYRQALLARLGVAFDCIAPEIDESRAEDEFPRDYVARLAHEKAAKIGESHSEALIIGSDQCAVVNGEIMGKPGDRETSIQQLRAAAGNEITFLTGLCVLHAASGWTQQYIEPFSVGFRDLTDAEIERYVDAEKPFDCAGSFKSEGYGVSLCQFMRGEDPTALIGLPLIRVCQSLREYGLQLP